MIDGHDVMQEIEGWYQSVEHSESEKIVVWHSHPQGNIGPSRGDLQVKKPGIPYLVVSLNPDTTITPCWF